MKPVPQTVTGNPGGNCFAACVASILELPLSEVPNFCAAEGDWWEPFQVWMTARGLFAVEVKLDYENPVLRAIPAGAWCILTGRSPRGGWEHAVVGRVAEDRWEYAHDPHPDGGFLEGNPTWALFIAVLDPVTAVTGPQAGKARDREGRPGRPIPA